MFKSNIKSHSQQRLNYSLKTKVCIESDYMIATSGVENDLHQITFLLQKFSLL